MPERLVRRTFCDPDFIKRNAFEETDFEFDIMQTGFTNRDCFEI